MWKSYCVILFHIAVSYFNLIDIEISFPISVFQDKSQLTFNVSNLIQAFVFISSVYIFLYSFSLRSQIWNSFYSILNQMFNICNYVCMYKILQLLVCMAYFKTILFAETEIDKIVTIYSIISEIALIYFFIHCINYLVSVK